VRNTREASPAAPTASNRRAGRTKRLWQTHWRPHTGGQAARRASTGRLLGGLCGRVRLVSKSELKWNTVGKDKIAIQPPSCPSPIQTAFGWDVDGRFQPVENPIQAVGGWELHAPGSWIRPDLEVKNGCGPSAVTGGDELGQC